MTFSAADSDGIQALDINQFSWLTEGYFVRFDVGNACFPTIGNGMTVEVDSGEIVANGITVSVSSQSVTLSDGDSQPRKDIVYLDSAGLIDVAEGTPNAAVPSGEIREATARPAPQSLEGNPSVIVAEIWVGAGVTDLSTSDLRDRRIGFEESALELSDLSGEIGTGELADESVTEPKIDSVDTPNDGESLTWNSAEARFEWVSATGSPGGLDGQIQYNDGGGFSGITGFTYDPSTSEITLIPVINDGIVALQGISFPNITGTPTFASHDHSEGGLSAIVNAGLADQAVTPPKVDGSGGSAGDVLGTDGTATGVSWVSPGTDASTSADFVAKSGDGTTKTFLLSHSLGTTPAAATVLADSEDASTDFWITGKTASDVEITYAAAPVPGSNNLEWNVLTNDGGGGGGTSGDSVTKNGDGTDTFSLSHSLGSTPTAVVVVPSSEDASSDFWVSSKSSTAVEITYDVAPPAGTDNLSYEVIAR